MAQSAPVAAIRFVFRDILGDAIAFPLWWYTSGFALFVHWLINNTRLRWRSFAVGVWFRNVFVPMFGQNDWQGRIISFCFRVIQIIARSIGFAGYALVMLCLAVLWLALPPAITLLVVLQILALLRG